MNATGRSKKTAPFVMLKNYVFDSEAYRSLKPGPRALLWELIRRFNGSNNGSIGLGVREACQALNTASKDTVSRYFRELEEKGFIKKRRSGGFNMKDPDSRRATEWELTWLGVGDELPSKEFMSWKPPSNGPDPIQSKS